jgi:hypothetical protein
MSNYYNNLDINEKSDDLSREKEEKKARKILKSIEDLKKRSNLNDDQKRKIDTEYLWRKFLDPSYTTHEEKKQLEKEREREAVVKKKKRDKKRVESERLNKIREEEQIKKDAKLQKEQDKREAERRQHEKEAERINKERYNQWRKQQEEEAEKERTKRAEEAEKERTKRAEEEINNPDNPEYIFIKRLRVEFNLLLSKGSSKKHCKNKLLLKYHPDKNRENDKWATMMTRNILMLFLS